MNNYVQTDMTSDAEWMTTAQAAARIGVSREVLLSWERRFGFPRPDRAPNGARRYTAAQVAALSLVSVRRLSGVPLRDALDEAERSLQSRHIERSQAPEHVVREVLDRLDTAVSILSGPTMQIEFANHAHRSMYPGRDIVGRPALEALTHSKFFDLASVLHTVSTTGGRLTWHETLVPHFGEDRWWNFSYSRLSVRHDEPVRVLLVARDVTDHVVARTLAERRIAEASDVASAAAAETRAFDTLCRVCDSIAAGADSGDPKVLQLVQQGLNAISVSCWSETKTGWERIGAVGGATHQLPGRDLGAPRTDSPVIAAAFESRETVPSHSYDVWGEDCSVDERVLLVPVTGKDGSHVLLLVEGVEAGVERPHLRMLGVIARLLGTTPAAPDWALRPDARETGSARLPHLDSNQEPAERL